MKKLLFASNLLMIVIIIIMGCKKTDTNPNSFAAEIPCTHCSNYITAGFMGIAPYKARSLSQRYVADDQPLLQLSNEQADARSVWFSLETLKSFIWQIENETCKHACKDQLDLGIRLYYGKYPNHQEMGQFPELDPLYAENHTIFMVPTFDDPNNETIHRDFDPWHWGNSGCKPVTMLDWFLSDPKPFNGERSLIFSPGEHQLKRSGEDSWVTTMNHGDLMPPYPPEGVAY